MSDVELLFLILALIYTWECAWWLTRGSVAFRTWFGRKWRPLHPSLLLGNQRGGFVFGAPLPPLGILLTGSQFPLSLSPQAVLAHVASTVNPGWRPIQTGKWARFEDIQTAQARGKKFLVNGDVFLKALSPTLAAHLAKSLQDLSKMPPELRASAIREMFAQSFDSKAIERLWQESQPPVRRLRLLGNGVFVYLFLFAPALIWNFGFRSLWFGLLIGLLALTTTTAFIFHRAHKKFFPQAEDDRFTHFLTIWFSPATTVRAHDAFSRPLLERFHPLALAQVFCPENTFRNCARTMLREIRYPAWPLCPSDDPHAQTAERFSRELLAAEMEAFLKRHGLPPEDLLKAPPKTEPDSAAWCPRCLAQFTTPSGTCADCGGLSLQPFAKA